MTPERIDEAMADLKDKGFGGVFVHPRPGMVTQYLDDNWFSLFRHTMEKGRELDMNVWIYDENSYPSGFCGRPRQRAMPRATTRAWRSNTCVPGCCPIRSTASSAACDVKATPHRHYGRSRFAAWRKGRLQPLLQGLQPHVAVVQRLLVRGSDARGRGRQIHRTDARRLQEGRGRGVRRHRSGLVHRRAADRGDRPPSRSAGHPTCSMPSAPAGDTISNPIWSRSGRRSVRGGRCGTTTATC